MDIYLKPEEIHKIEGMVMSDNIKINPLGDIYNAIAKASADNAVRVIIEYLERITVHNKNTYDEYWGYQCIDPDDWQALKKLISKE